MKKKIMIGESWPVAFVARDYDSPDCIYDIDFESEEEFEAFSSTMAKFHIFQALILKRLRDQGAIDYAGKSF